MVGNSIPYGIVIQVCHNDPNKEGVDPRNDCADEEESWQLLQKLVWFDIFVIDNSKAKAQDIRPLKIAIFCAIPFIIIFFAKIVFFSNTTKYNAMFLCKYAYIQL